MVYQDKPHVKKKKGSFSNRSFNTVKLNEITYVQIPLQQYFTCNKKKEMQILRNYTKLYGQSNII